MIENMHSTPVANRFHIAIFGRRNAGKSSLINALTGQEIAVTSEVAGTTTDPVFKAMELLPIGPVVLIDTAGLDDEGELGRKRVEKSYEVLRRCHFAVVVIDSQTGWTDFERAFLDELRRREIPALAVLNKADLVPADRLGDLLKETPPGTKAVAASAVTGEAVTEIKAQIVAIGWKDPVEPALLGDLVAPGAMALLVTPIDKAAPKGRLILPQQQVIRDLLDHGALVSVTRETELERALSLLAEPPAAVITDSQAFKVVAAVTPPSIPLTSFSILFARQKGDLAELIGGIGRIAALRRGEKVLIVEGCTHHRQDDDIGTVKIPRWIREIAGDEIRFDWASGASFPRDLSDYAVVVHCGGCMLNRREMTYRIAKAREEGPAITNYGLLIAYVTGILERAVAPFPEALQAWEETVTAGARRRP